ncbi:MAG TPA: ASCH domain-containing protein [Candidatus Paceibacterota bacterium]|nr:ASCH domain-containing protein [Candidatus Paceibacterota bacterium]
MHEMRMHLEPFSRIRTGSQIIESRLNDEKRQRIKVGDQLTFLLRPDFIEKEEVEVTELLHVPSFRELFALRPLQEFGVDDLEKKVEEMREYYFADEEAKYGVVGIKFKKI